MGWLDFSQKTLTYMANRTRCVLSLTLLLLSATSCRQPKQTATPANSPSPAPSFKPITSYPPVVVGKPYPGKGVVKLINRKENWIEIVHEEIVDLMPPMEMEWSVKKPSMLDHLSVGDKVTFIVVETGKGELITEIKKIQE